MREHSVWQTTEGSTSDPDYHNSAPLPSPGPKWLVHRRLWLCYLLTMTIHIRSPWYWRLLSLPLAVSIAYAHVVLNF